MKRPLTTSFSAPPPARAEPPEPAPAAASWRDVAPFAAALIATLEAIEAGPKAGPAMRAHRSAMRRQGEAAAALGGSEALEAVLNQVAEADAAQAAQRLALIREAWTGLPGEAS
ncbi:hypothetical protein CIW48_23195 [Methylobacterium sp. P1-11]|uniref:hypothetical protein n=1 Tax=Methylobacterium sp. P1-11 TaxID=2024616 RepID=UPI0011EEACDB|nr:hypothetical protein [Methylobacterium sp. P1-11]KAA0121508.1 hypothetical protein CIW48_23195 [Methylobacterium sp. P1-11]